MDNIRHFTRNIAIWVVEIDNFFLVKGGFDPFDFK